MIKSVLFLFLIFFSFSISMAQEVSSRTEIQKISNGALWYEYIKHENDTKSPTIVFESGALSNSNYWNPVIGSVSKYANTIRYDRAGLGRSLPSTDTIRSADKVACELKELLDSIKMEEQIILVCHSAGGFYGRIFSHLFGDKVKALVLIESPCSEWERLLRSALTEEQNEERNAILKQNRLELSYFERKEYQASEINLKLLNQIPKMQIPVYIIYGNNHHWPEGYNGELFDRNWKECQNSLKSISNNSQIIIANGSGHHVFQEFDLPQFLHSLLVGFY